MSNSNRENPKKYYLQRVEPSVELYDLCGTLFAGKNGFKIEDQLVSYNIFSVLCFFIK